MKRGDRKSGALGPISWRGKTNFSEENFEFSCQAHIPKERIVNSDQTAVSYITPDQYIFDIGDAKTISVKEIGNNCQITASFCSSMSGEFTPIQVIYGGKMKR